MKPRALGRFLFDRCIVLPSIDHIDHTVQKPLPWALFLHQLVRQRITVCLERRKLLRCQPVLAEFRLQCERLQLRRNLASCQLRQKPQMPEMHDRLTVEIAP